MSDTTRIESSLLGKIFHRLARRLRGDDYAWSLYPEHYAKEMEVSSTRWTGYTTDFTVVDDRIVLPAGAKPIHPGYVVLYRVALTMRPSSVLEIGPGWGDQLMMLREMLGADVHGIDISQKQIDGAVRRHPDLAGQLVVGDVTKPLPVQADLVYCNAVTMHLGPTRVRAAVENIVAAARDGALLIENWSSHDYEAIARDLGLTYEWVEAGGAKGMLIRTSPG